MTMLDPYTHWLGIPAHERPLDFYRLLGLPRYESRPAVIEAALQAQAKKVRTQLVGSNEQTARRVLGELKQAGTCLMDPAKRQRYDAKLRQLETSATDTLVPNPAAAETVRVASAARSDPLADVLADVPAEQPRPRPPQLSVKSQSSGSGRLWVVSGAVLAVLVLVGVGGIVLWKSMSPDVEDLVVEAEASANDVQLPAEEPRPKPTMPDIAPPAAAEPEEEAAEETSAAEGTGHAEMPQSESEPEPEPEDPSVDLEKMLADRQQRLEAGMAAAQKSFSIFDELRLSRFLGDWDRGSANFHRGNYLAHLGYAILEDLRHALDTDTLNAARVAAVIDAPRSLTIEGRPYTAESSKAVPTFLVLYGNCCAGGTVTMHWLWEESLLRLREEGRPAPKDTGPTSPFAGLPGATELPPMRFANTSERVPLLRLPADRSTPINVALLNVVGGERQFTVEPAPDADGNSIWKIATASAESSVATAGQLEVAELRTENDYLLFQWLPDAAAASGNDLRNCALHLGMEDWKHRLHFRQPHIMLPVTLDLDARLTVYPLPAKASLPSAKVMTLSLLETTGFPQNALVVPESSQTQGIQPLRLVIKHDYPKIEIRVSLFDAGGRTALRIEPVCVDVDDRTTIPFTTDQLNTMYRILPKTIAEQEAEYQALERQIPGLVSDINRLSSQAAANAAEANVIQQAIAALRQKLRRAESRMKTLSESLPQLKRRQEVLPGMADLGNTINRAATLTFRVSYPLGEGEEADVLVADPLAIATFGSQLGTMERTWTVNGQKLEGKIIFLESPSGQPPGAACSYSNYTTVGSVVVSLRTKTGEVKRVNSDLFDVDGRKLIQQEWDIRTQSARDDSFAMAADNLARTGEYRVRQAIAALETFVAIPTEENEDKFIFSVIQVAKVVLAAETHLPPKHQPTVSDSVTYDMYRLSPTTTIATRLRGAVEGIKTHLAEEAKTSTELQDELRLLYVNATK